MNDVKKTTEYAFNPSYERNQSFNRLVAWLHSQRYRHVIDAVKPVAPVDRPLQVLDLGCGFGKLYDVLRHPFRIEYTGVDPQADYLDTANERYGANPGFRSFCVSAADPIIFDRQYDVVTALETMEHIDGPTVVRIIERIAHASPRRFVCSVPIEIGPSVLIKNFGSVLMGYSRHKTYTWKQTVAAGFYQLDKLPRHTTSHLAFDWRWLAQTIRDHFRIVDTRFFPFRYFPASVSTTAFFVAEPRPAARRRGMPPKPARRRRMRSSVASGPK
jgi:2-polyprenyl-3-methyl-5-hydroxy-6-metoxy-1,4-benzoquinol methylase